jgi:hypothetical protein
MMWFKVSVEDKVTGIRAVHYVQAVYPSTAREQEESKGFVVLEVAVWGANVLYPRLPNYVGR